MGGRWTMDDGRLNTKNTEIIYWLYIHRSSLRS
jgi:hypothetical protein